MAERRLHGLQRVLGTNALFATAYGNVGSSIYYALGLVASYALGLTPVIFIISGVFDWDALRHSPGDIVGGAMVIAVLVAINVFGAKESTGVNVGLAVVDFATQLMLVVIGVFVVLSPH